MTQRGLFICFEGADGTGKSTQAALLSNALRNKEIDHILTREPYKTTSALDSALKRAKERNRSTLYELKLLTSVRKEHITNVIYPALVEGKLVICDRYIDSTYVYQGIIGGIPKDRIDQLITFPFPIPDITIVLQADLQTVRDRILGRDGCDNDATRAFLLNRAYMIFVDNKTTYYNGVVECAANRLVINTTAQTPQIVHEKVMSIIEKLLDFRR